jgi:RNA polymerase sigma-70 factor (ECF subfamily)
MAAPDVTMGDGAVRHKAREMPVDAVVPALTQAEARWMARDGQGLLAALARGEAEAFQRVVEEEFGGLYAIAWGILGNGDDAEDACQETFLKLHRAARKLSPDTSLRAWLRRVCVNCCLDERRRRKRRGFSESLSESTEPPAAPGSSLQQAAEGAEFRVALARALALLPPRQRAVFVLRHFHECSVGETSDLLGCAEGTTKAHLSRALRALRKLLSEWSPSEVKGNADE